MCLEARHETCTYFAVTRLKGLANPWAVVTDRMLEIGKSRTCKRLNAPVLEKAWCFLWRGPAWPHNCSHTCNGCQSYTVQYFILCKGVGFLPELQLEMTRPVPLTLSECTPKELTGRMVIMDSMVYKAWAAESQGSISICQQHSYSIWD